MSFVHLGLIWGNCVEVLQRFAFYDKSAMVINISMKE